MSRDLAYRGYLITWNPMRQEYVISKDGAYLATVGSIEDAKEVIKWLVWKGSPGGLSGQQRKSPCPDRRVREVTLFDLATAIHPRAPASAHRALRVVGRFAVLGPGPEVSARFRNVGKARAWLEHCGFHFAPRAGTWVRA